MLGLPSGSEGPELGDQSCPRALWEGQSRVHRWPELGERRGKGGRVVT